MDGKDGIMMCKLKGRMDTGGHYNVGNQRGCKMGQYDVQLTRADE